VIGERNDENRFTGNFTKEWVTNYVTSKTSPHGELTVEKEVSIF
jgi:hypothetical protein